MGLNKSINEACLTLGITVKSRQREASFVIRKNTFVCAPQVWTSLIFQALRLTMDNLNKNEITTDIKIV